jgi:hypothetical protein
MNDRSLDEGAGRFGCKEGTKDPSPRFDIHVNGQQWYGQVAGTSKRVVFLTPGVTYTFRVKLPGQRDRGGTHPLESRSGSRADRVFAGQKVTGRTAQSVSGHDESV